MNYPQFVQDYATKNNISYDKAFIYAHNDYHIYTNKINRTLDISFTEIVQNEISYKKKKRRTKKTKKEFVKINFGSTILIFD